MGVNPQRLLTGAIQVMSKSIILLTVSCLLWVAPARAEQVGAQIYDNQCKSCHGSEGLALDTPILHGQEPAYIVKSLQAFKKEIRKDQIMGSMNTIAASLSLDDMKAVAHFLAGLDSCDIELEIDYSREGFRNEFSKGRQKYAESNCSHCHSSFHHYAPRIIGQKPGFLTRALEQFRTGERVAPMMPNLLRSWTDDDYRNVVSYLSGMRLMRACGSGH